MGFKRQSNAERSMSPTQSKGHSRLPHTTIRRKGMEYLDRWSPRTDPDHYLRVKLYHKRKIAVSRYQRSQENRPSSILKLQLADFHDTRPFSRAKSDVSFDSFDISPSSSDTDVPQSSLSPSDLTTTLQEELDEYDDHIKSLHPHEWPAPPQPRAQAIRIGGSEFSRQKAKELKQWSFVQGSLYGQNSVALRDSDRVHPAESYGVGVIFSAPHHTPSSADERWVSVTDPHNTATPFGIVHSKYRKMIVIKAFGEHCLFLPIYTHHGRGLEGKSFLNEFVSIRDASDPNPEPAEGPHGRLTAIANSDLRGQIVAGKSNVKTTEICCHRYDAPATIEETGHDNWHSYLGPEVPYFEAGDSLEVEPLVRNCLKINDTLLPRATSSAAMLTRSTNQRACASTVSFRNRQMPEPARVVPFNY
ncbi:hypothetical protein HD806DRAFT_521919 [Xylariaceae sp. AK1471]|nr:hypothetical protein HD806DRAFT_521919 [Xylariaceae sp. AK1471]